MSRGKFQFGIACLCMAAIVVACRYATKTTTKSVEENMEKPKSMEFGAIKNPKPKRLLCFCSDPRCPVAFNDELPKKLELAQGQFVRISVFGGATLLAHQDKRPHDYQCLYDQIALAVAELPDLEEGDLIVHQGCRYFAAHNLGVEGDTHPEKSDLPRIVEAANRISRGKVKWRGLYAYFIDYGSTIKIDLVVP